MRIPPKIKDIRMEPLVIKLAVPIAEGQIIILDRGFLILEFCKTKLLMRQNWRWNFDVRR